MHKVLVPIDLANDTDLDIIIRCEHRIEQLQFEYMSTDFNLTISKVPSIVSSGKEKITRSSEVPYCLVTATKNLHKKSAVVERYLICWYNIKGKSELE